MLHTQSFYAASRIKLSSQPDSEILREGAELGSPDNQEIRVAPIRDCIIKSILECQGVLRGKVMETKRATA